MTRETSRTIAEWATTAFGPARAEALVARAATEMDELRESLSQGDFDSIASEAADVAILLHRIAHDHGHDLSDAVDAKMARNRLRRWEPSGDGTGRHVAEPAVAASAAPAVSGAKSAPVETGEARLGDVLFDAKRISIRVRELAAAIERDLEGDILIVGVLKGAGFFTSDLARALRNPAHLAFVGVSSYGMNGSARGEPRLTSDVDVPVAGRKILLVEDLVDTGGTLSRLVDTFRQRGAADIRTAVLLDLVQSRPNRRLTPDYVGFETSATWVSGYGIDYKEKYRNLPDIHEVVLPSKA
ncbi:phosphoribosyltransferase family protein [Salinarimonas ramus]|uniref:Phosphoribosyltransferase domain-containing protein n=1 Tax=Salinarimonas ramus TaxID=690164 RepID=A0A917Q4J4_9HYPH|nr:phosphoribosyltransferase family protein [Salinarimonas ramus]GGK22289.1 hypothetical protein GCM10011322_06200 [Salinarimonas ramus]